MTFFATKQRVLALLALIAAWAGAPALPTSAAGIRLAESEPAFLAAGRALMEKGAYEEAIARFQEGIASPETKSSERASAFHALGYLLLSTDRREEALRSSRAAVEWARGQGLPAEAAMFKAELAVQQAFIEALELREAGDIAGSNGRFAAADSMAVRIASRPYQLRIASVWSVNYAGTKEGQAQYLKLSLRALDLAGALNYNLEASKAAKRVGTYYAMRGEYSRALSFFLRALNYLEKDLQGGRDFVSCLNNIAVTYGSIGDYVKAKEYLLNAASRLPGPSTKAFESSLLLNLGNMFLGLGRRLESEDYQQRALECYTLYLEIDTVLEGESFRLDALAGLAAVYLDQNRLEEARKILSPALEEARRTKAPALVIGKILSLLGNIAVQTGATAEAQAHFEETRTLAERTDMPLLRLSAAFGLGRCAEERQDYGQAIENYELALRIVGEGFSGIVSDIQRAEFIGRSLKPFQALVGLYLKLSRTEDREIYGREMFRLSEYLRARSFLEFRNRLSGAAPRPEAAAADLDEAKLGRERAELLKTLARGGLSPEARDELEKSLVRIDDLMDAAVFDRYVSAGRTIRSPRPISLEVLQGRLDDRTAVLEYLLGDTASILFCVTKDSLRLVELPPAKLLQGALTGYLSFLEDSSMDAAKGLPAARRLYQVLLEPAVSGLRAGVDRLIIVPDGMLFRLPFEALVPPASGPAKPAYLIDRFAVSYAPSASSLESAAPGPAAPGGSRTLAFGVSKYPRPARLLSGTAPLSPSAVLDDVYGRSGFEIAPLPHVRKEIADLAGRFAPGRIDVFEGREATESALKGVDLASYGLIHLACHAFSDDNHPLRSALRLAPEEGDEEDGYLQVSEMYGLGCRADLVVLSACQTGRGTIVMNEGNLGLPRVFFYMGARSVLSTLWPVNDEAGAAFMKLFYDAYFRGQDKAAAVRAAKKAMREKGYAHPCLWAPYVLTGGY